MMKQLRIVSLVVLSMLLFPQMVSAADMKVGVLDFRQLVAESKEVKNARKELEAKFKPKQEEIITLQNALKADMEKFQRDGAVMTEAQKKTLQEKVLTAREDLNSKARDYEQALNQAQNQTMQTFFEKVKKVVDEIAKKEKFDLILQKEGTPYARSSMDITNKVAKKL